MHPRRAVFGVRPPLCRRIAIRQEIVRTAK